MKSVSNIDTKTTYKSIFRAAKILTCLSDGKNSVTEIAEHCELSKSTVSRLLAALEKSNLAIRDPLHRKYFLGYLINRLVGNPKTTHLNLVTLSADEMNSLSKICGETVVLDILVGVRNIRLHTIPSVHNIRVYDDNYDLPNLDIQGAAIKVLLSQLNQKELTLAMNYIESEDTSDNHELVKNKILPQLTRIREQGYDISRGERIAGAVGISAAIRGYYIPSALSVLGIESRFKPRIPEMLPVIVASANRISMNLQKHHYSLLTSLTP
jgi:DNA-binding IclR family transcriptional regulator